MANGTPFMQAATSAPFGMLGLGGVPTGADYAAILAQLGVQVPSVMQGLMPRQMMDVLNLQRRFAEMNRTAPTFQTYFRDPERSARLVLDMWERYNRWIESQGGTPVGILDFVRAGGFTPEIQMMFETLFASGPMMAQPVASAPAVAPAQAPAQSATGGR